MAEVTLICLSDEDARIVAAATDRTPLNVTEGWRDRVNALPAYILKAETLASPPDVIAEHLRGVAKFLENRRDGVPFGGHEYAARVAEQMKAFAEKNKGRPLASGGRRRRQ